MNKLLLGVLLLCTMALATPTASFLDAEPVSAVPASIIYNLYATDGFTKLADGTPLYIYGFVGGEQGQSFSYMNSLGAVVTLPNGPPAPTGGPRTAAEAPLAGNAQLPAPVIWAKVGDTVTINLKNLGTTLKKAPNDPHTIHLHGIDVDAANDGVPETSVAAVPANAVAPGAGNVVVYMFAALTPGTYMYHCHQEASIHVQMGMYGALVVYNQGDAAALDRARGPNSGFGGSLFGFNYDKDVIMLLSEIDVRQHTSEQAGAGGVTAFNPVNYQPQYWMINGLSFPNTIHAGVGFVWANWLATHKGYDPLITGIVATGQKVLVRMINLGFETQPMHVHGFHPKVIGSDQRAWSWAHTDKTLGAGLEKNTITIGSGETYELLFDFAAQAQSSTYQPGTQTRYDALTGAPSSNTTANPAIPDPFTPPHTYIGGPTVAGVVGGTALGIPFQTSQFFPFHNHDDYKATNNGVYPGGQFTFVVPLPVPLP